MYYIENLEKWAEVDDFQNGCGGEQNTDIINKRFENTDLQKLIKEVAEYVGCFDKDSISLNCCEEIGRIDMCLHENDKGEPASQKEVSAWKNGSCRLWWVVYTTYVYQSEPQCVDLSEFELGDI